MRPPWGTLTGVRPLKPALEMCREDFGLTDEDLDIELKFWQEYVKDHIPQAYPGIRQIMEEHKKEGIDALILPTLHEKVTTYTEMVPKTHRVRIGQRCTVCNEKKYTEEYLKSISGD